jgi:hypothetical protein
MTFPSFSTVLCVLPFSSDGSQKYTSTSARTTGMQREVGIVGPGKQNVQQREPTTHATVRIWIQKKEKIPPPAILGMKGQTLCGD